MSITQFNNGDPIPVIQDNKEWSKTKEPACCYYENDTANGNMYGLNYNYYAIIDSRGLAPDVYKIPEEIDFRNLISNISPLSAKKLKSKY